MGNTVATICYDSVSHNRFQNIIVEMRSSYNLTEARPEYLRCLPGKRCEGAQVITVFGNEYILEKFVDDVIVALTEAGAKGITSTIRFISFNRDS